MVALKLPERACSWMFMELINLVQLQKSALVQTSKNTIALEHTSKLKSISNTNYKLFICRPLKSINSFIYFTLKPVKHTM